MKRTDNMKRTGFNGYDVDDIKDIYKYLIKKNGII